MRLRLPSVLAILAAAVIVLAPLGGLAVAGIDWGECCCGHEADDCPNCSEVDEDRDDTAPGLRACGVDAELVPAAALPRAVVPAAVVVIPPRPVIVPDAPPRPAPPPPPADVETPPPRAGL